jgi:hypothetical protein
MKIRNAQVEKRSKIVFLKLFYFFFSREGDKFLASVTPQVQ